MQKAKKGEPEGNFFKVSHEILESHVFQQLHPSSQMLYVWLCKLRNRRGTEKKGFVQVSDRELEKLSGMPRKTISRAKKQLDIYGFITWRNSKRFGCRYEIRNTIAQVLK